MSGFIKTILVLGVILPIALVLVPYLVIERRLDKALKKADPTAMGQRHISRLSVDINELQELAAIQVEGQFEGAGESDASLFFKDKLPWQGEGKAVRHWNAQLQSILALSHRLKEAAQNEQALWDRAAEVDLKEVDFSWMVMLRQFDHWEMEKNSLIEERLRLNPRLDLLQFAPTPQLSALLLWTKLRFLKGLQGASYLAAFEEVRQLARLLLSTNELSAVSCGLRVLAIESRFFSYVKQKGFKVEWQPVSETKIKQAIRLLGIYPAYFHVLMVDELREQVFLKQTPGFGFCTAVNEGVLRNVYARAYLKERFARAVRSMDTIVLQAQKRCRPSHAQRLWFDEEYDPLFGEGVEGRVQKKLPPQLWGVAQLLLHAKVLSWPMQRIKKSVVLALVALTGEVKTAFARYEALAKVQDR